MQDEEEPIKENDIKEEEWSEADDNLLLIDDDFEEAMEKGEEESLIDFPDIEDAALTSLSRGKNISKAMDATQLYLSEIGFSPLLSAEEEVHYATLALKGDTAARKK